MTHRRTRSLLVRRAVVVIAASSVVMGQGAAPADAALNCRTGYTAQGFAFGKCTSPVNGSYYRVAVLCQNWVTRASYVRYGNRVHVNAQHPSTVTGCNAFEAFYGTPWTQTVR